MGRSKRGYVGIPTRELLAIDGLSPSTVVPGKIASLQHEIRDDTVETGSLVAKAVHACGKLSEVFCGLWDDVVIKLEYDSTPGLAVHSDIELRVEILSFKSGREMRK